MQINTNKEDTRLTIAVEGKIDTVTAPDLESVIRESLDGITDLTLDFGEVTYISSAGFRVLMVAKKIMDAQGTMAVCNLNDLVKDLFEVTGFSDILTVR